MKLFVLGASGGVGKHLVAQAREAGHDVTAVVRPASHAMRAGLEAAGARIIEGEVLGDDVLDAMAGHDVVLSSLGMKRKSVANPYSALTSPADFNSAAARVIVAAMQRHGVRRVIAVSAAGVGDSAARMNALMRFLVATSKIGVAYRDLAVMERVYAEASAAASPAPAGDAPGATRGIDWLCPRPTRLTDGPRTNGARVVDAFGMNAAISRADVAAWMLAQLDAPAWGGDAHGNTRTPQISVTT